MNIEIRPLSDVLGAEVIGADLARFDNDEQYARIHQALLDYGVLAIRDQHITPEQHIAFSRRFGELEIHVLDQFLLPDHPEILRISNKTVNGQPIGLQDAGNEWHTDLSYQVSPALGSLLYALEIPPRGGDTLFANLYVAYDALTDAMKARLDGLQAIHAYAQYHERSRHKARGQARSDMTDAQRAQVPEVSHPLIRTHPETGRKALYLSPGLTVGIEGLNEAGQTLLKMLNEHATQPAFTYRHRWQLHDVLFWDNRCTIHLATAYDSQHTRHMHRTTIKGGRPL